MAFRRNVRFRSLQASSASFVLGIAGDSGQAMRGSSVTHAPAMPGMRVRERTRGGATRDTYIVNRER